MCPILAIKPPWTINFPWTMHSLIQGGLGQSFAKCSLLSQLKHLTLNKSRFAFLINNSLLANFSLSFWGHVLPWPHFRLLWPFAPTTWANLVFLGDLASSFTFGAHMSFILHTLHHLHQPLTRLQNINPLVDYLLHPRHKSMEED